MINLAYDGMRKVKTIQKGLREYMLCESCEACINKYEQKFKTYWYDSPGVPERMDLRYKGIRMPGAEHATTKLFHLSVLWRAGMSQWCKDVSLGPYGKKIGDMLLTGAAGSPECFPVFGTVLVEDDGTVKHGLVTEPLRSRFADSHAYYMCYPGCEWYFIVTDHPTPEEMELARGIDANGNIWMPYMPWRESGTVKILSERLRRAK